MNLNSMLQQAGVIDTLARELSIDKQTARLGAGALLPAIVAGMGRAGSQGPAAGGLGDLISGLGGGGMLDAVLNQTPTPAQQGNDVLGAIFGSKDTSRSVASEVAGITGLDEGLLKKMLPILAMAAAGYMAKNATSSNQAGGGLGGLLGTIAASVLRQ